MLFTCRERCYMDLVFRVVIHTDKQRKISWWCLSSIPKHWVNHLSTVANTYDLNAQEIKAERS